MKILRFMRCFTTKTSFLKNGSTVLGHKCNSQHFIRCKYSLGSQTVVANLANGKLMHTETDGNEELEDFAEIEADQVLQVEPLENARDILFKNSKDEVINELNSCVSVREVLNVVKKRIDTFEDAHVVQTIFVLKDLQNICHHYSSAVTAQTFIDNLCKSDEFDCLMKYIENKLTSFDPNYLCYVLLYLYKLGLQVEQQIMQDISVQIRDYLHSNFSLKMCSSLLKVIFSEDSVRPYYTSLNLIPKIISFIGKCESVEDLGNLTMCLNSLNNIVTNDMLNDYKKEVLDFLNRNKLKSADYKTILKIILFFNYPKWRNQNVTLTSDCILLMQHEIGSLNITEIISLQEVFFKNHEPGEVLNDIQRSSAKHLQRFDSKPLDFYLKLKLFSSLIYFSSPIQRIQFRKDVHKYLRSFDKRGTSLLLRKLLTYIRVSDETLCSNYWDLCLKLLNNNMNNSHVQSLCMSYLYFNIDIQDFRHYKFEHTVMKAIEECVKNDGLLIPSMISSYLSFAMVCGKSQFVLSYLLDKFETNLSQFKASDCLKLSHSIFLLSNMKDSCIEKEQIDRVKRLVNDCMENIVARDENNFLQNHVLVKASVLRNDYDNETVENILMKYKELDFMSSKLMENICYMFSTTDSLIPEVINKCTEYVIKYPKNIIGFNAEKILGLCFYLAYYPINADKFFEVVTNIIIRDQERLSGLAFLHSALGLCYFNKLPSSFIKQIFNVEFLEKVDVELAHCYSKDKYPQRVRTSLMHLNRAVCLEYPEYNIPWFHRKYIDEMQKRYSKLAEGHFTLRIKDYLIAVVGKKDFLLENVITPYGYYIDFVVNLNRKDEPVSPSSEGISRRVAILLVRQHMFTRFYAHLKGKYQLKKRHLEILGYSVVIIRFNEWINLLYAEERLEYLLNKVWQGRTSELKTSSMCYKRQF